MKIAIVTFHNDFNPHNVGGLLSAPLYMKSGLESLNKSLDIDILSAVKPNKYSGYPDLVIQLDLTKVVDTLSTYDFIIFNSPGIAFEKRPKSDDEYQITNRYDYVLKDLKVPFTFVVNEENDRKLYPYRQEFHDHEYFSTVLFNSIDMHQDFPDYTEHCDRYVEFNYVTPLPDKSEVMSNVEAKLSRDKRTIGSTARWSTRKRISEYVGLSKSLSESGLDVLVYGDPSNYF